jgi:hypothetical protein
MLRTTVGVRIDTFYSTLMDPGFLHQKATLATHLHLLYLQFYVFLRKGGAYPRGPIQCWVWA